jgi:hypothetical protein
VKGESAKGAHQLFPGLEWTGLADWRSGEARSGEARSGEGRIAVAEGASGEGRISEGRTSVISWTGLHGLDCMDRTGGLAQRRGAQRRSSRASDRGHSGEARRAARWVQAAAKGASAKGAHQLFSGLDWTGLADWRTGAAARCAAAKGAVGQWRSGAVAQWRSGAVAQWRSGEGRSDTSHSDRVSPISGASGHLRVILVSFRAAEQCERGDKGSSDRG